MVCNKITNKHRIDCIVNSVGSKISERLVASEHTTYFFGAVGGPPGGGDGVEPSGISHFSAGEQRNAFEKRNS